MILNLFRPYLGHRAILMGRVISKLLLSNKSPPIVVSLFCDIVQSGPDSMAGSLDVFIFSWWDL